MLQIHLRFINMITLIQKLVTQVRQMPVQGTPESRPIELELMSGFN